MSTADDQTVTKNGKSPRHKDGPIYGRNRPTKGWRGKVATLMVHLHLPNLMPNRSSAEEDELRLAVKVARAWELLDKVTSLVVAFFHFKGGVGKTPIAAYLSCYLASKFGVAVAFVDGNPGSTSPGRRMGMWGGKHRPPWAIYDVPIPGMFRRTATISELFYAISSEEVNDARTLQNRMKQNHYGVATLVADPESPTTKDEEKLEIVNTTLDFIIKQFPFVIVDTGNDFTTSTQRSLATKSTDYLFPAYVPIPAALDDLQESLAKLNSVSREKVSKATVVFTGLNKELYDRSAGWWGRRPKLKVAADYGTYLGPHQNRMAGIMGIPYDPVIEDVQTVRLDLIQQETEEALLDVLIAVLEQNVASLQVNSQPSAEVATAIS